MLTQKIDIHAVAGDQTLVTHMTGWNTHHCPLYYNKLMVSVIYIIKYFLLNITMLITSPGVKGRWRMISLASRMRQCQRIAVLVVTGEKWQRIMLLLVDHEGRHEASSV